MHIFLLHNECFLFIYIVILQRTTNITIIIQAYIKLKVCLAEAKKTLADQIDDKELKITEIIIINK